MGERPHQKHPRHGAGLWPSTGQQCLHTQDQAAQGGQAAPAAPSLRPGRWLQLRLRPLRTGQRCALEPAGHALLPGHASFQQGQTRQDRERGQARVLDGLDDRDDRRPWPPPLLAASGDLQLALLQGQSCDLLRRLERPHQPLRRTTCWIKFGNRNKPDSAKWTGRGEARRPGFRGKPRPEGA